MKGTVLARGSVRNVLNGFVFAELYTDRLSSRYREVDAENARLQREQFGSVALPLYLTLGPDGRERSRLEGLASEYEFLDFLKKGLEEPPSGAE